MKIKYCLPIFIICTINIFSQNHWTQQHSGVSVLLNTIKVVDQNTAWAAGDSGKVIRTANGGITWSEVDGGNFGEAIIWNMDALDSNSAFVTISPLPLSKTYIYRTTNGGSSWENVFSQDGGFINNILMINNDNGFAYGDPVNGKWTFLKTNNGGASWYHISTEPAASDSDYGLYYNSLFLTDSLHIWFVGNHRVYRSVDGGITWSNSITEDLFLSIWFDSDVVGMAGGREKAYVSLDSGKTWTYASLLGDFYAMAGSGTKDYWFASNPHVVHTSDYGSSWSDEMVMDNGQLFAIDFVTIGNMAYGYAAGTGGRIVRYEGIISSINDNSQKPNKFILEQNYPNPFNPTTKIEYSILQTSFVAIRVYDVLGREVATLVNEEKYFGKYNVEFNGINLSSGIYLYKIQAGNYSSVKKMILIK